MAPILAVMLSDTVLVMKASPTELVVHLVDLQKLEHVIWCGLISNDATCENEAYIFQADGNATTLLSYLR